MPKNAHTLQLKSEREAMEAFGLTRSQAREALLKASKLNEAARVKEEFKEEQLFKRLQAKLAPPQLPEVQQKFEPKAFGLGGPLVGVNQPLAGPNVEGGTFASPYDLSPTTGYTPDTNSWDREAPPAGTDGLISRQYTRLDTRAGGTGTNGIILAILTWTNLYDSKGALVRMSAETLQGEINL